MIGSIRDALKDERPLILLTFEVDLDEVVEFLLQAACKKQYSFA